MLVESVVTRRQPDTPLPPNETSMKPRPIPGLAPVRFVCLHRFSSDVNSPDAFAFFPRTSPGLCSASELGEGSSRPARRCLLPPCRMKSPRAPGSPPIPQSYAFLSSFVPPKSKGSSKFRHISLLSLYCLSPLPISTYSTSSFKHYFCVRNSHIWPTLAQCGNESTFPAASLQTARSFANLPRPLPWSSMFKHQLLLVFSQNHVTHLPCNFYFQCHPLN